jgi:branched-chain amino acid transport system permease protein
VRGRPELITEYAKDQALLGTTTKKVAFGAGLVFLAVLPWLFTEGTQDELTRLFATAFITCIGAIGINIVAGYAGQISLAHAFFLGLGAYTAAVIAGPTGERVWGLGISEIWIWLPIAGLVPALVAIVVGPLAVRVRGLYLAVLTLGLVELGTYLFRTLDFVTGGSSVGRNTAPATLFGMDLRARGDIAIPLDRLQRMYFLGLLVLLLLGWLAANFLRSAPGRAFTAVRDRDVAAELMGVNLLQTKTLAFAVSAFYAGVCGAMLSLLVTSNQSDQYNLVVSLEFLAIILIGGMGRMSGAVLGTAFVVLSPRLLDELPQYLSFLEGGATGGFLNVFQLRIILYGVLIIVVLIAEPRGAYGVWLRMRNYFKAWPFSY